MPLPSLSDLVIGGGILGTVWLVYEGKALFDDLTLNTSSRGIGTPLACGSNEDYDAGLCYPKCSPNYKGVGPICWGGCGENFVANGGKDIGTHCTKGTYGRGIGTVPNSCDDNQDRVGELCYPKCRDGYKGVGPVCWEQCKSGDTDIGVSCCNGWRCHTKDSYGRGAGHGKTCGNSKDYDAGLCYNKCKQGYSGKGPVCWQTCGPDTTDIGVSCQKKSNSRGVGKPIHACPTGKSEVAGLCYKDCPVDSENFGLLCRKRKADQV
jgi:hypothetical protein